MPHKPDIVISGINNGYNTATDIQYSGTCGAAFEGAFQGILSVALSEDNKSCHEVLERYLPEILQEVITEKPSPDEIINVNFPCCPLSEFRGILRDRKVSCSMFYRDTYRLVKELPGGGVRLEVNGEHNKTAEEGSDTKAVVDNYISIGRVKNVS